jgi:hypothetical protein
MGFDLAEIAANPALQQLHSGGAVSELQSEIGPAHLCMLHELKETRFAFV